MKKKLAAIFLLTLIVVSALSGCAETVKTPDKKLTVAVTIVPVATFVQKVCGDCVDVITTVPPGSSPESYEPTPQEMLKLADADIYFAIGVGVEEAKILPSIPEGTRIVKLQETVSIRYPDLTVGGEGRDEHIWLSPRRVTVIIDTIMEEMSAIDPTNAAAYIKNAKNYNRELVLLDIEVTETLSSLKTRKFIVFHPAFAYFADDYELEMYSLEEEGKEATVQHMMEVIDLARNEGITVIFYQEELDSTQSQAFADELSGRTIMLSPLAADYIANIRTMANTLAGVMGS